LRLALVASDLEDVDQLFSAGASSASATMTAAASALRPSPDCMAVPDHLASAVAGWRLGGV
jgi:hypothetical protein